MSFKINKYCISCGTCFEECPQRCIYKVNQKFIINEKECDNCGMCLEACPAGAVTEKNFID